MGASISGRERPSLSETPFDREGSLWRTRESFACLRGRGTFVADGTTHEASAWTILFLEPDHFHRIEAIEECVILVAMTPHSGREGYARDQIDRLIPRARQ